MMRPIIAFSCALAFGLNCNPAHADAPESDLSIAKRQPLRIHLNQKKHSYTVPAGNVLVIECLSVQAGPSAAMMTIKGDNDDEGNFFYLGGDGFFLHAIKFTLKEGEVIDVYYLKPWNAAAFPDVSISAVLIPVK